MGVRGGWLIEMAGVAAAVAAAHQTCLGDEAPTLKVRLSGFKFKCEEMKKNIEPLEAEKLKGAPRSPKAGMPARFLP